MEQRLAETLKRIGQADQILRKQGRDPEPFMLLYSGGNTRDVLHPTWDESWPTPTAEDIDDLVELGHLRVDPNTNAKRLFALTVKGREQAAALAEPPRTYVGGRAPGLDQVIDWIREQEHEAPENLEAPGRLVPAAVSAGLIDEAGREALASRIIDLHQQGYLAGEVPDLDQATNEQRLQFSDAMRLTMKAHEQAKPASAPGNSITFTGSVVANQIAAGDISNYVSVEGLLESAEQEIAALVDVDEDARDEARGLIDVMLGRATSASGAIVTGAGGVLLASVLARLLGLPVG
jgi:hypothetical protein